MNLKVSLQKKFYSLDASAIGLPLQPFPWVAHRADTANVTLRVCLNHANLTPGFVVLSDGNESDIVQWRQNKELALLFEFDQK